MSGKLTLWISDANCGLGIADCGIQDSSVFPIDSGFRLIKESIHYSIDITGRRTSFRKSSPILSSHFALFFVIPAEAGIQKVLQLLQFGLRVKLYYASEKDWINLFNASFIFDVSAKADGFSSGPIISITFFLVLPFESAWLILS